MKLNNIVKMANDDNHGLMMSNIVVNLSRCSQGGLITFGISEDILCKLIEDTLNEEKRYSILCFIVDKVEEKKYDNTLPFNKNHDHYQNIEEALEEIVNDCKHLTSANVSHNAPSIQGAVQQLLNYIKECKPEMEG